MKNKLFKKRLELLHLVAKAANTEVYLTKNDNYCVKYEPVTITKTFAPPITKSTIGNPKSANNITMQDYSVVILTKDNKLKIKTNRGFTVLSPNSLAFMSNSTKNSEIIASIKALYYYNKNAEWLKYTNIFSYPKLTQSFNSPKKLINFLGVTSNIELNDFNLSLLVIGFKFKNKTNLLNCYSINLLQDMIGMIETNNVQYLYESTKSIKNIHDELVELQNKKDIDNLDETVIMPEWATTNDFQKNLKALPYEFKLLNSAKLLGIEGLKMKNCIRGYSYNLPNYVFLHIVDKKEEYTVQLNQNHITQCVGYANKNVGIDLVKKFESYLVLDPIQIPELEPFAL